MPPGGVAEDLVTELQINTQRTLMQELWRRVKWHDQHKQVYWRFVLNGLVTPDRFPNLLARGGACFCSGVGHQRPCRSHLYWNCHVAQSLLDVLCSCLGVDALDRRQLWLMEMPVQMLPPGFASLQPCQQARMQKVLQAVWRVVCLAALEAMGRLANKIVFGRHELVANPRGAPVVCADLVVVTFWDLLADFSHVLHGFQDHGDAS